jgi:hypothetical protein
MLALFALRVTQRVRANWAPTTVELNLPGGVTVCVALGAMR